MSVFGNLGCILMARRVGSASIVTSMCLLDDYVFSPERTAKLGSLDPSLLVRHFTAEPSRTRLCSHAMGFL